MRWLVVSLVSACGFAPGARASSDAASAIDVAPIGDGPVALRVAHVPPSLTAAFDATAALTITNATLDTGVPMVSVMLPDGAHLITSAQDGGGPELAILEVGDLIVTGALAVTGTRPLVIIARSTITVSGTIDASATQGTPGPGGLGEGAGSGSGGSGADDAISYDDSGGGGGGFGQAGAAGQVSGVTAAGASGKTYGTADLATLEGASGGGAMSPACAGHPAGAGGGAIQLFAGESITIDGAVRANGGGGAGGLVCNGLGTSGAGGGAGGAIYLQSQVVSGTGLLLAQGGGGGGASDFNNSAAGADGGDGMSTIASAPGGTGAGTGISGEDNSGGAGGYRDAPPPARTAISGNNYGNGGGAGGGAGRIVIRASGALTASPAAVPVAP